MCAVVLLSQNLFAPLLHPMNSPNLPSSLRMAIFFKPSPGVFQKMLTKPTCGGSSDPSGTYVTYIADIEIVTLFHTLV